MAAITLGPSPLLDLLFDQPGAGRCLVAPDGSVLRVNAEWLRATGLAADEVLGADLVSLFPATRDMALAMHARARAGHHVEVPPHAQQIDGRETWWEGSIDPVPMDGGAGLLVTARDITPRAGEAAWIPGSPASAPDAIARIRDLADHAPAAVFAKDPQGRYLFVNRWLCELFGMGEQQAVGRGVSDILPEPVARRTREIERRVLAGEEVLSEDTLPTPKGERTFRTIRFPFPLGDGTVGLFGIGVDVTDRQRAESSLRESEERFRLLTEAMPQIVCVLGADGTPDYVNGTWTAFSGLDLEATARLGWHGVVHPDDRAAVAECRRQVLKRLAPRDVEVRYRAANGTYRWFLSRLAPVVEGGRVVRLIGAAMDIEDRKWAEAAQQASAEQARLSEEQARASEERARRQLAEIEALYATAPVGLCVFDRELRWVRLNDRIAEINGVPAEAHLGRTPREIVPSVGGQAEAALRRILETGEPLLDFEMTGTTAAAPGVPRVWNERWVPIKDGDGRVVAISVAAEEITERKRAERALRESEQMFATLFQRSPLAFALARLPGGMLAAVNDAWVQLTGVPREEALGKTSVELGLPVDLRERARLYEELEERGSVHGFELRYATRANGVRALLTHSDVVTIGGERYLLAALQDITEWKRAEEGLRDADRRKDEFLGMLSHELRNPLAPIRNAIYILRHADGTEQAHRAKDVIERQTDHLTRLVDDLLDVTRIARGKIALRRDRVDLRDLVRRSGEDLRSTLEDRGVALRVNVPAEKLWTLADPTRISQILGNLLSNAAKFTRAGDAVTVSLERADGELELSVADTGAGIEPSLLPDVFEPFVQGERTLARTQGGLGLGLALVKGIAELHGGRVRAESGGKGKGTCVRVRLPLLGTQVVPTPPPRPPRDAGTARRVLVVDDNRDAADSLAQIVTILGHFAEVAYDGRAAVAKVRESPPDVVLCDIGLPGMDGYEVARQIRADSGGRVRLIAVSGYAQPEDLARAAEAGFDGHVAKPSDPDRIESVLR